MVPEPVALENLIRHFKNSYGLSDEQVEIMIQSSANSLTKAFVRLYEILEKRQSMEELARQGHRLKGILLNMGEYEWAEVARQLELSAYKEEQRDYRQLIERIENGTKTVR